MEQGCSGKAKALWSNFVKPENIPMERETVRRESISLFLPTWAIAAVIKKMTPVAKAQSAKVLKT